MKTTTKDAVLFVRLTSDLHKRVVKEAASVDISAASLIRGIVRRHFDFVDAQRKTKRAALTAEKAGVR